MSTTDSTFLGIIAFGSLVQTLVLIGLAIWGLRTARRVRALSERLDRELLPALDHLRRISRNLSEVSDLAVLQARRIDLLVADTVDRVDQLHATVHRLLVRPLGPIAGLAAFLKGIRRGVAVYRKLGGHDRERGGAGRRYDEDEHLFI
jgi:hypothetical protein